MNYPYRRPAYRKTGVGERIEYRIVVLLCFALCLAVFAGKRMVGHQPTQNSSIFAEAYSAAVAAVGYAYTA